MLLSLWAFGKFGKHKVADNSEKAKFALLKLCSVNVTPWKTADTTKNKFGMAR